MGMSRGRLWDPLAAHPVVPNDETFWGRLQDVGHTCFSHSSQKHIKLTLAGYSRLYSEL